MKTLFTRSNAEANLSAKSNKESKSEKSINPKAKWMSESKWGFFTHFLAHMASDGATVMSREQWNKKVNSFDVKRFANQLSDLRAPYFFITIGQQREYFCTPSKTFDKRFGADRGVRTERDLIAELAAELVPRGVKMCVYLPTYGSYDTVYGPKGTDPKEQEYWLEVITEWSERWGESISAWWVDGRVNVDYSVYRDYFKALKAGNKDALVATKLWYEYKNVPILDDYMGGESGFLLAVNDKQHEDYHDPETEKIPVHFLTFLGEFWGVGDPRFPVELVTGWTQHINNLGGPVSWDCPLTDSGGVPEKVYEQLAVLSQTVNPEVS